MEDKSNKPIIGNDEKANYWLNNKVIAKLRYGQDYDIYMGDSKPMFEDGRQSGISITREHVRFFSTGITKMFELVVLGKDWPDVEYTEAERAQQEADFNKRHNIVTRSIAGKVVRKGAEVIIIYKANGKLYRATDFNNEVMDAFLHTGDEKYLTQLEAELEY